jgi:CrcB protein
MGEPLSCPDNPGAWVGYVNRARMAARLSASGREPPGQGPAQSRIDKPDRPTQSVHMSLTLLLIALGGAAGSILRYLMVSAIGAPLGTGVVNVLGSFAIGVLFIVLGGRENWQGLLMTGLMGGFTTFSAFSLDTLKLIGQGQTAQAAIYVLASVSLSLIATALGVALARGMT